MTGVRQEGAAWRRVFRTELEKILVETNLEGSCFIFFNMILELEYSDSIKLVNNPLPVIILFYSFKKFFESFKTT